MNIFYLHNNQTKNAQWHNNKHCVKQILEYAQLLSTAHRILDGKEIVDSPSGRKTKRWVLGNSYESMLYKATHANHPSAIWCRYGYENYQWLAKQLKELCLEYTYRYGKVHKCEHDGLVDALQNSPLNISTKLFTEPTPAMPDDIKISGSSILSYRNYYIKNKPHLASWKKREIPEFYHNFYFEVKE